MVRALHDGALVDHGGAPGILNAGQIESTLARPLNTYAYAEAELHALAASYGFGFARIHCFVDGNKRIALIAMDVFLQSNGHELVAPEPDAAQTILAVEAGEMGEAELAAWVRENIAPLDDGVQVV